LGDFVWERFKGGALGSLWYYRSLVKAFRQAESTPIVENLDPQFENWNSFLKPECRMQKVKITN